MEKKTSAKKHTAKSRSSHDKRNSSVGLTPDKAHSSLIPYNITINQVPYVQRIHKDTLFRFVFRGKENLLQLYNALNHSSYENPEDLIITTLENVIYLGYKNDVSFLLDAQLFLFEHQSTWNPNMPLRGLLYFARLLRNYVEQNDYDLFSTKQIPLPLPQYVIFYNGMGDRPERQVLLLSDAFKRLKKDAPDLMPPALECRALVLNINYGRNRELLEKCRPLMEYSCFVHYVRENIANDYAPEQSVDLAVNRCLKENILTDVLRVHRKEVVHMFLEEYDQELHYRTLKREGFEDGFEAGFNDGAQAGEERINTLNRLLLNDGRTEDLLRCVSDPEFQKELFKEYHLDSL